MAEEDEEQDQRHKNQSLNSEQNQYKQLKYQPTEPPRDQRFEYHPTEQTPDQRLEYPSLTSEPREKLIQFFHHIIANASVDYTNPEIQDIQNVVYTMLERIRTRVNSRGIFRIARLVRGGSMAEQTSLWKIEKYLRYKYLEFDFLAALENAVKLCIDQTANCPGCIKIVKTPVDKERLRQCYNGDAFGLEGQGRINFLFIKEINYCLTSSCNCLTYQCKDRGNRISLRPSSVEHKGGCGECTVDMSTGTLHVNTEISVEQITSAPNKCSLIFRWISKAKRLSVPDELLFREPQLLSSLPIYVDFLPALESLKPTPSGAGDEHGYFIVPKSCNVRNSMSDMSWRKSWCLAEINAFTTDMSDKHRRCYQVIKFLSERHFYSVLPNYHMKTVVLNHHTTCRDTTDDCVDCVIGMLRELLQAYETNELLSFQSNLNILHRYTDDFYEDDKDYCERLIYKLCSVSATDTWKTFISKVEVLYEKL